jgi:2-dehydro-3-deoxyphosphogluconate aldolase / (4S)-4-hydroxy-2-oxoglutarate aldolase
MCFAREERMMNKEQIRERIEEIGLIASVRVSDPEKARFAAEVVNRAGIPIVEITMTIPGAIDLIAELARSEPEMIVGAGTVLDEETARRCVDAGAKFLTSPGLVMDVLAWALKNDVVVLPGAFSPTEVITAWKAGADFVKIFPCAQLGGDKYIRALKVPLPQVRLIASGGVNQQTAAGFILAGASAVGVGTELMPREALRTRQKEQIQELARRFLAMVRSARIERAQSA